MRHGRTAVAAGLLAISACVGPPARHVNEVVEAWLTCTECTNGELAAVRAAGGAAAPVLSAALDGPRPQSIANMTRSSADAFVRARRQWTRLSASDRLLRPLGDSVAFVERNVGNYRAMYQLRAAQALILVDPARARSRFARKLAEDSLGGVRVFRPDVRRYVDSLVRSAP